MLPVAVIPQLSAPAIPTPGLAILGIIAVAGMVVLVARIALAGSRTSETWTWGRNRAPRLVRAAA